MEFESVAGKRKPFTAKDAKEEGGSHRRERRERRENGGVGNKHGKGLDSVFCKTRTKRLRERARVEIPCVSMAEEKFSGSLHSSSVALLPRSRSR